MLTASLRLTGTLSDGVEVTRSYYLTADFDMEGIASAIPLSLGAPMPDDAQMAVRYGSEEAALKAATEAIKALPGNRGLAVRVTINPE